jgi:hypothetical protein
MMLIHSSSNSLMVVYWFLQLNRFLKLLAEYMQCSTLLALLLVEYMQCNYALE